MISTDDEEGGGRLSIDTMHLSTVDFAVSYSCEYVEYVGFSSEGEMAEPWCPF
jgi:hypothetical protein